jgi:hypothetical protein
MKRSIAPETRAWTSTPALAGLYLADLNAGPDVSDGLAIGNPKRSRSSIPPTRRSTSRSTRSPAPGR